MTKILILPPGASDAPVSHGRERFQQYLEDPRDPGTCWLVEVPDHVAEHFCLNGGFQVYEPQMRRRFTGERVPLIHGDGSEPCSLSFDGDSYHSELTALEDGSQKHVIAFPAEGVSEIVGVHPGYAVLSLADHQAPEEHPGTGWELLERNRRLLGNAPLQGGGVRELDIFPSNVKRAEHPDGIENPEREAKILAAEAALIAAPAEVEPETATVSPEVEAKPSAKSGKAKG